MEKLHTTDHTKHWRLMIVDDHPLVRFGLVSLIEGEPDLEVCAETGRISEALELARSVKPDLAIIDLSLADGNGLELVKRLKLVQGELLTLVCSMHDEILFAQRALNAGANGYINKQEATNLIIDAVRHVLRGKIWLSEAMTERVLLGITKGNHEPGKTPIDLLSDRELEVFGLIGQGLGPSQIAEQLHLSVKTIETHREKIKKKLSLSSGSELTRQAMQWSLEQN